ncbi:MAG: hypothetical protein Q8S03_02060 [Brevundimonas sp.]|uniref:hypothetical protein n=1 Tax=Brevundimonas sp. TaxID=1871086 RepID=UPI002735DACD|nr:hypothetical protein [Brevundimonas sp.]MDP3403443.1 hypothetical protein [Brevundimonas sp.]
MKRPIAPFLIVAVLAASTACRERPAPEPQAVPEPGGWIMPPQIESVAVRGTDLSLGGRSAPLGRVAVGDPGGQAYAVAADGEGRFELRIPRPARDTLFVVEGRAGQQYYPAPYRLMVAAGSYGPIGLVSIGAPTRRLDPGPSLDAVDTDGRATFLSGRAPAGSQVIVRPGPESGVTANREGRWTVAVAGGTGVIEVAGQVYSPPAGPAANDGTLESIAGGWRISWRAPDGARQTTWFPERRTIEPGFAGPTDQR